MGIVKVLIVENELLIAADMKSRLAAAGFEVAGEAASAEEAFTLFQTTNPDVVLMDIDLDGEADGIEAARSIRKVSDVAIIFLTDIDNKKIISRASQVAPSAYLVKPFNERQMIASIHQALHNLSQNKPAKPEGEVVVSDDQYVVKDALFIRIENGHFRKLPLGDILYMEADGAYTHIMLNKEKIVFSKSLNQVHDKISQANFVRISRSHVVNMQRVDEIKGNMLHIEEGHELQIGEKYKDDVMKGFRLLK